MCVGFRAWGLVFKLMGLVFRIEGLQLRASHEAAEKGFLKTTP